MDTVRTILKRLGATAFSAGVVICGATALPVAAEDKVITSIEAVEATFNTLTEEQNAELAEVLGTLLSDLDFSQAVRTFSNFSETTGIRLTDQLSLSALDLATVLQSP